MVECSSRMEALRRPLEKYAEYNWSADLSSLSDPWPLGPLQGMDGGIDACLSWRDAGISVAAICLELGNKMVCRSVAGPEGALKLYKRQELRQYLGRSRATETLLPRMSGHICPAPFCRGRKSEEASYGPLNNPQRRRGRFSKAATFVATNIALGCPGTSAL